MLTIFLVILPLLAMRIIDSDGLTAILEENPAWIPLLIFAAAIAFAGDCIKVLILEDKME